MSQRGSRPAKLIAVGALAAALSNAGCSFIFVSQPPPAAAPLSPKTQIRCTTDNAAPVVDGVLTVAEVARTTYALVASDADYLGSPISRGADIGLGVAFTVLFLTSAWYGFQNVNDCRDLVASRARAARAAHPVAPVRPAPTHPAATPVGPAGPAPAPLVTVSPTPIAPPSPSPSPSADADAGPSEAGTSAPVSDPPF